MMSHLRVAMHAASFKKKCDMVSDVSKIYGFLSLILAISRTVPVVDRQHISLFTMTCHLNAVMSMTCEQF